jgi:IS1 family transposase
VCCRVYYSYVDTPPSQQQLLQVYDAVIAATESGAQVEEARAWVRTHLADPDRATTAVGATTLAIDPKQASLAVQG